MNGSNIAQEELFLYLVYPNGRYENSVVIVAPTPTTAYQLFNLNHKVNLSVSDVSIVDLTRSIYAQGYDISVTRKGILH